MNVPINDDLSENVSYDHPLFPAYLRKGLLSTYPDYTAVSHWHDDIELIVILEGVMDYNVNGEIVRLEKGTGILISSRQLHFGFSKTHQECEFLCILLHPSLLCANDWFRSRYVFPFFSQQMPPYVCLRSEQDWQSELMCLGKKMFAGWEEETGMFLTQELFWKMFRLLYQELSGKAAWVDSEQLECLKQMVGFIQTQYTNNITLEQIARAGGCCKSKCTALFQQYLSQPPIQYLIAYRLSKSIDLLLNTNQPLTEIAFSTGFHGSSYYCETFRKHFGLSPKEYRKKNGT